LLPRLLEKDSQKRLRLRMFRRFTRAPGAVVTAKTPMAGKGRDSQAEVERGLRLVFGEECQGQILPFRKELHCAR
jgi:hypothetical protein